MKTYLNRFIILAGCALTLAACSENAWNDKLDGFDDTKKTPTQTVEYTLTATDYTFIANKLSTATALANANGTKADLALVGTQGCFNASIDPEDYLPLFLANPSFPYFSLPNGSAVKVTYRTNAETDPVTAAVTAAKTYTVSLEDYQKVWDSDNDYTEAFAPSKPAAKNIPALLKNAAELAGAVAGDYVLVNYKQSETDPVFTTAPDPVTPEFTLSNVLGSYSVGDEITVNGLVMAVSTQGPVIADAAGAIWAYKAANNSEYKVGDQVVFTTNVTSYASNFCYQITQGQELEVKGNQTVTYPTPKVFTGAEVNNFINTTITNNVPQAPVYGQFTGTVVVSGNYININVDGADSPFQLSPYGMSNTLKAQFTDGATVTFEGYCVSISSKKFMNIIITKVGSTPVANLSATARAPKSRAVTVASTDQVGVYKFDGTKWAVASNVTALNRADYQAMGQTYDNLSGTLPQTLLPIYLKTNRPYAVEGNTLYIAYAYYNGSETVTRCDKCVFNGTEWNIDFGGTTTVTAQYVKKSGAWFYSPDVVITLAAGRNIPASSVFYQACVDWVRDNVPDGAAYISSYGNNDYYTGASAYQNNVDLRPDKAREQNPAAYEGMTDDEIIALEKKRFTQEVVPAVLAKLYPDLAPTPKGVEPTFTVNYYYYTGAATLAADAVYRITAPGTYTFESANWSE